MLFARRPIGLLSAAAPACTTPDCVGDIYEGSYSRAIDGRAWRCRDCRAIVNIRRGSFFEKSKSSLSQLVRAIYFITKQSPNQMVMEEAELASATVVDWANFIREVRVMGY